VFAPGAMATVGVSPTAAITATPNPTEINQSVTFDASGSTDDGGGGTINDFAWDLDGDGTFETDTGITPSVAKAYAASGTIVVGVKVTDNEGDTDVATVSLRVNAPPHSAFLFSPSTPAVNEQVTFSSISTDDQPLPAAASHWDFDGDGNDDAVGSTVTHAFTVPGNYTVGLRVTDSDGKSDISSQEVIVQANPPKATFTFSPQAPKTGQTIDFDASGSAAPAGEAITDISWDLDGDGEFNDAGGPRVSFSYPSPGPRTVSIRVQSSGGGFDIHSAVVKIQNRGPTASFSYSPAVPRLGDTIALTSTSTDPDGPITSIRWDLDADGQFDDAAGATAQITPQHRGAHRVAIAVTDANGATDTGRQVIQVQPRLLDSLSPFPVVRLTGSVRRDGKTDVARFAVHGPRGARVTARCIGSVDCPFHSRTEKIGKRGRVKLTALQRRFGAKTTLEVFVTQKQLIGKFTRFKLRQHKPPKRVDRCVKGNDLKPIHCPRS
jgi:PKD repeat protein